MAKEEHLCFDVVFDLRGDRFIKLAQNLFHKLLRYLLRLLQLKSRQEIVGPVTMLLNSATTRRRHVDATEVGIRH